MLHKPLRRAPLSSGSPMAASSSQLQIWTSIGVNVEADTFEVWKSLWKSETENLDFETLMFEQMVIPGKSMSDIGELVDSTF